MKFQPKDENFIEKVRENFAGQSVMQFIGAKLVRIEAGEVEIELPFKKELTQQNGFLHAGIITTIADSACGYAAFSLMPKDADVLSIEFKVNLLSPAIGEKFLARSKVLRAGKNIFVVQGDVFAVKNGNEKHVSTMLGTMMCVQK
jgi:uncharacterized protein (TIGR00369 family)